MPPKYGLVLSLLSTGVAVLFGNRAAATRQTARRVIGAAEQVKQDGTVDFAANAAKLNALMGAAGKRLVDEAQGKRTALPL